MRTFISTARVILPLLCLVVGLQAVSPADPETKPIVVRSLGKKPIDIARTVADRFMARPPEWDNYMGVEGKMPPNWSYSNGVTLWAMLRLSDFTGETKYRDYVRDCYRQYLEKGMIPGFGGPDSRSKNVLNNSAMMMSAAQELYRRVPDPKLKAKIDEIIGYFEKRAPRTPDGTFCHEVEPEKNRIWIDAVFQVAPLQARYAGDNKRPALYDDAVQQILSQTSRLMDPEKHLYYQGWGWGIHPTSHSPGFWSRGNGWMVMSFSEVLEALPADHPKRGPLMESYKKFLDALLYHQDTSGMWHQLIDRQDSYEETSGSAMFLYAIARAVQNGWIDKKNVEAVRAGMQGIRFMVDPDGVIWGTCVGTGTQNTLEDYYGRPAPVNDYHGIGPVILACTEAARLKIE